MITKQSPVVTCPCVRASMPTFGGSTLNWAIVVASGLVTLSATSEATRDGCRCKQYGHYTSTTMVGLGSKIPPQELQNGWNTCKSPSFLPLSMGWFGRSPVTCPRSAMRFCGRSSEAALRSFDIAFIDPAFGVRYGKGLCHSFLLCLPH